MDNYKHKEKSKMHQININNVNNLQLPNKSIRSKSKNVYNQQNHIKRKNNQNAYIKPKPVPNNKNLFNQQDFNKINMNNYNNNINMNNYNNNINMNNYNNNINMNNYNNLNELLHNNQNENKIKKSELIQLQLLKKQNNSLKISLIKQDELLKNLHDLFLHNYNQIKILRKKYSKLKRYLENSIFEEENDKFMNEKMEEEFALRAVEQQIMDEICPNPDKMSYEQLLELEEGVGNVNKGLSKDKINKIPVKPFHKALFEDNSQCIICMEGFVENELVKQLPCGHIFHEDCINHWLEQQKNCPFCKAECINYD